MKRNAINMKQAIKVGIFGILALKAGKALFHGKEPVACTTMRESLLATQKVAEWEFDKDPSVARSFPEMPFDLIKECGAESFKMPFPYVFTFDETADSVQDQQKYVDLFLAKNKTVAHRPADVEEHRAFGFFLNRFIGLVRDSFDYVWGCINSGECILYFDNSWTPADYGDILGEDVSKALFSSSDFGSMFLSNYNSYRMTAGAHAAPIKSLATQFLNYKDWIFYDPKVVKKYLRVETSTAITIISPMTQNHDEIMNSIPRYFVRTGPGQGVYFPEFWVHIVYTAPGVNLMANWRQSPTLLDNLITSPHRLRNRLRIFFLLFMKTHVVPDFVSRFLQNNGQDDLVERSNQMTAKYRKIYNINNKDTPLSIF